MVYLFGGGDIGLAALLIIAVLSALITRFKSIEPRRVKLMTGIILVCSLLVVCSSWPAPLWLRGLSLIWVSYTLVLLQRRKLTRPVDSDNNVPRNVTINRLNSICLITWILTIAVIERPFQQWPTLPDETHTLLVIGDSVTAGLNDGEDTWPRKLGRVFGINVIDASQPGATLKSALKQSVHLGDKTGVVVLEIGGNDMLERLPVDQFEADLARLLSDVITPGRTVILFELPLPPFCESYGIAQRRQARLHRVQMIPKRHFAKVLTGSGSTVDGIHLSDQGQSQMQELICRLFRSQLKPEGGTYQKAGP